MLKLNKKIYESISEFKKKVMTKEVVVVMSEASNYIQLEGLIRLTDENKIVVFLSKENQDLDFIDENIKTKTREYSIFEIENIYTDLTSQGYSFVDEEILTLFEN